MDWWRILNNKWRQSTLGPSPLKPREAISTPSRIGEEEMERISEEQQNRLTLKWERDRNEQDRLQEE
jgi:hypothetical protein